MLDAVAVCDGGGITMRLIDADALKRRLETNKANVNPLDYNTRATYFECITMVENSEIIETEPVRHGRWVDGMPYINSHWKVCSVCHRSADHPAGSHEYCGRCGAKMDAKDIDVPTTQMDGGTNDGHEQG